jgi:hypothetical protein
MCYTQNLSLLSFLFGISCSFILIELGNESSVNTNKTIGYFFMFVSLMQFVEFLLWSDINCKNSWNKIGSSIGPLLNHLQPVILVALSGSFLQSNELIDNNVLVGTNGLYILYVLTKYKDYIQDENNLCTKLNSEGHLNWNWKQDFNYNLYHLMMGINIINYVNNINLLASIVASYVLLGLSINNFNQNIGEFWCLMVTGIPLLNIFIQKVLDINN